MFCIKCGREVDEGQVFCKECLECMENEPIKINTPVRIPVQPPHKTSPRRQMVNPEEEMRRLEKLNQSLFLILMLLFTTVLLLLLMIFSQEIWSAVDELGKNYSVVGSGILP